ncbi:MAG: biotin--[acetyl-CoA-carboxylase] ligase [Bacteroidetes bacterium]|nr:biotin--[acetyl-CoA-carboxylase] ligase [Bacteroidota bacterium]
MSNAVFTRVLEIDEVLSTNAEAKRLCKEVNGQNLAVWTRRQIQGRGQVGTSWFTGDEKDIAISFVFYPGALPVQKQFLLNMVVCNAVYNYVKSNVNKDVSVKWPNDILIGRKKVCGILIENVLRGNTIDHSVIGIGLNVNTKEFPDHLPHATSIAIENFAFIGSQRSETLDLIDHVSKHVAAFYEPIFNEELICSEYLKHLFGINKELTFIKEGQEFKGAITGVDDAGKLKMLVEGKEVFFGFKEIQFQISGDRS